MKRLFYSIALCGMIAASVSCEKVAQKNSDLDVAPGYETVTLEVGTPTKVYSVGATMRWLSAEETMAVVTEMDDRYEPFKFTKPAGSASEVATFEGTVPSGSNLAYAVFPYNDDPFNTWEEKLNLNLQTTGVTFPLTNSVPRVTPLYSIITGSAITMKSPCAYLKIDLPQAGTNIFGNLTVTADGCAGNFTVDVSNPSSPVVSKGDANSIQVVCKGSGSMYVPILPGTYSNIGIELTYTDGHPAFSRTSTASQTLESGNYYEVGYFSGAYVKEITVPTVSVEGSTLSVTANANVWKYCGVTNSDYAFKLYYRVSGSSDEWTEFSVSSVSGDGADIAFSGTATVDGSQDYDIKAVVTAGGVDTEFVKDFIPAPVGVPVDVTYNLTVVPSTFAYLDPTFADTGKYKIVTADGDDQFPQFNPGASASYYYKAWDGSSYGSATSQTGIPGSGMIPARIPQTVDEVDYSIVIGTYANGAYYTINSKFLCWNLKAYIELPCPTGHTLVSVEVKTGSARHLQFGIGTSLGTSDVVAYANYRDESVAVDRTIDIPSPVAGQTYYINGDGYTNRLQQLILHYIKLQ